MSTSHVSVHPRPAATTASGIAHPTPSCAPTYPLIVDEGDATPSPTHPVAPAVGSDATRSPGFYSVRAEPIVKECRCGRCYSAAQFADLPFGYDHIDAYEHYVVRTCPCSSSIAVVIAVFREEAVQP